MNEENMYIICDTNIWYGIARGELKPTTSLLVPTFTAMMELAKTENHRDIPELVASAIVEMVKYKQHSRMAPPFVYLKRLDDRSYNYDLKAMHGQELQVIDAIAKGMRVEASNVEAYLSCFDKIRGGLNDLADFMNAGAAPIKARKINTKAHRKEDPTPLNRDLMNQFVGYTCEGESLSESFDWNKVELLMSVMRVWYNDLELSGLKVQPNDIFDLYQMVYVQPGDLFWTLEGKWIRFIKQAGMEKYLYQG
jgi:hypothetical protein